MVLDDLEPGRAAGPKDLSGWNIEDLEAYIAAMRAEIARAEAMIARKRDIGSAADALFRR